MSAAEVHHNLKVMAERLTQESHYLEAVKCYTAILNQSLLPTDEATARLRLAHLLLEHTCNVADARVQLQKAELLVTNLPGQQSLHCEVLAELGRAHKYLGETTFQRQSYLKGIDICKDTNRSKPAIKQRLAEWAVYFYMRVADSYITDKQPDKAMEHAQSGCECAKENDMLERQMLCLLFRLQLLMLMWDKKEAEKVAVEASDVLTQLKQSTSSATAGHVALLQLHFMVLQALITIRAGNYEDLGAAASGASGIISQMESHLEALPPADSLPYSWLPAAGLGALVQLLAAIMLKPQGKVKAAMLHISRGLQLVDALLTSLGVYQTSTEATLDHINVYSVRSCLVLRVLLLETRMQLQLLSSSMTAARQDAADSIQLLQRFPTLLVSLVPSVHLQAGLYAQAVDAHDAALAHLHKAAACQDEHMRACAQCLAALCCLARDAPGAVSQARELLGNLPTTADSTLGYAERAMTHISGALLQLSAAEASASERADAKQHLSKALKIAHERLQNHQLVSQVLLYMTPLQVSAPDLQGAMQMVTSSFTLAKGAGDLHAQVAGLTVMQQLYQHSKQPEKAAQNANYLARKQEDLSGRMNEAEASQQHMQVLTWGL